MSILTDKKQCSKCRETKYVSEFYVDKRRGPRNICKVCHNVMAKVYQNAHPEQHLLTKKAYYARNKERIRARLHARYENYKLSERDKRLQREYGITLADYNEMFSRQNGVCAICGGVNQKRDVLFVDHDHKTGAVRGLLCNNCNSAIGHFGDNPDVLLKAAEYLKSRRGND